MPTDRRNKAAGYAVVVRARHGDAPIDSDAALQISGQIAEQQPQYEAHIVGIRHDPNRPGQDGIQVFPKPLELRTVDEVQLWQHVITVLGAGTLGVLQVLQAGGDKNALPDVSNALAVADDIVRAFRARMEWRHAAAESF